MNTFQIETKAISGLMKLASSFLPSRSVVPIIENFKIDVNKDEIKIHATNLQHGIVLTGKCSSEESFSFVCPPLFRDTLERLPSQVVTITVGDQLVVKAKEGEYQMLLESAKDYPERSQLLGDRFSFTVSSSYLALALKRISFCASKDEDKPKLNGVLLSDKIVATDAHMLGWMDLGWESNAIVPVTTLNALSGLLKTDTEVEICRGDSIVEFKMGTAVVWGRLVEGEYPNWKNIIPSYRHKFKVDREALVAIIGRAILYTGDNKGLYPLRLKLSEGVLHIGADNSDYGTSSKESIKVEIEDSSLGFEKGVNAKYFQELINSCNEITIECDHKPNTALVINDEDVKYLLMPVRL